MSNSAQQVALITGATGFIGLHLTKRLISSGWEVHSIVRANSNLDGLKQVSNHKNIIHCHSEVASNMSDIIASVKPTVVFHLASLFLAQHEYEDISRLIESNIMFGTQLVDAMVKNQVFNLINTGTSWQHYHNEEYNPVCLYAATKQAFESMLTYYQRTTSLKVITLKLFDTYGPGDTRKKLFTLLKSTADNNAFLTMSAGEQLIDLVYIDDVIDAYLLAAKYLLSNNAQFLGDYAIISGNAISLKDLVTLYEKILGKKLNIDWGGRPYRDREVMVPWRNGRRLPAWEAKVQLIEGIRKILEHKITN